MTGFHSRRAGLFASRLADSNGRQPAQPVEMLESRRLLTASVATVSVADAYGLPGIISFAGQAVFPVSLSTTSPAVTTFNYSVMPGTAPSTDFHAIGSSVTIPAGSTQATIPVDILENLSGGDETFTLTLSSLSSNAVFSNGSSTLTATGTILVTSATSSTNLSAAFTSLNAGDSDTFTATVVSNNGTPTGTVTFNTGTITLGTIALSGDSAVLTTSLNTSGEQAVTATYNGNSYTNFSTSSAVDVAVVGPTTTTLAVSSASVAFGGTETLTTSISPAVSGAAVTGTVTFSVDGTAVGTAAVAGNSASLAINLNTTASQSITTIYSGDTLNDASISNPIIVVVAAPSTLVPTIIKSVVPTTGIAGQPFKGSILLSLNNSDQIAPQRQRDGEALCNHRR